MTELNWPIEYSVGVEDFDFHHKRIFSMLDELRNMEESDTEKKNEMVDEIVKHIAYHLLREEILFKKFKYKYEARHVREHNKYRAKIDKFIQKRDNGTFDYADFIQFLEGWWVHHIVNEDKKYQEVMNENGVY